MMNETKNGTNSMSKKKFLRRPPWKAIQYAMGKEITRSTSVAAAAK
jgi:hypothetical protein